MTELSTRFAVCLIAFVILSGTQFSVGVAQENITDSSFELKNDPLKLDGPLQKVGEFQNLFEIKTSGTKLATEIISSFQEAQPSISQIRSKTRSGGGSTSSGNGTWMSYFQGNDFFGHISMGKTPTHMLARFPNMKTTDKDAEFLIQLQELSSPQRELFIEVDKNHAFDISLRSSEIGYSFRFRQESNGRIVCLEMSPEFLFARTARSFDDFSKQNQKYVQNRLMRVLDFAGVENPTTRYSSTARQHVLMMLRPGDEERMNRFRKAVEKMNASSYQDRETATAEIEQNFQQWQDLIQIGMSDTSFNVETRTRLTKIHGKHVDEPTKQLMKLAQASKLHLDTEYLIWALGKTEDASDKQVLAKQLSKLTDQEFGFDTAKWAAWFAGQKNSGGESEIPTHNQIEEQTGPIDSVTEFVQQLIKFTNRQGELQLDRNHWGRPFGDQPIEESVEQVKALMKKNNLPLQWLEAGGKYSLESSEYPQVIFANMVAKLESENKQPAPQRPTYGYLNQAELVSRNRFANTSKITAQMQFHKETGQGQAGRFIPAGTNRKLATAKYLYLYLKEQTDAKRVLEIHESENNIISITLISNNADTVIRFVQHPATSSEVPATSRCSIFDIRANQSREFKAASFEELLEGNATYLKNEWLPLMEKLGIQIDVSRVQSQ